MCVIWADNLGTGMPQIVVHQELKSLNIRDQEIMQFRSGRRDQEPTKDGSPSPLVIVSGTSA